MDRVEPLDGAQVADAELRVELALEVFDAVELLVVEQQDVMVSKRMLGNLAASAILENWQYLVHLIQSIPWG